MEVYRLTRRRYAGSNPFDGEGAFLFGGRWSSVGTRCCYASTHRSLAILEYRAHIDQSILPDDLVIATLEIPEDLAPMSTPSLPGNWKEYPAPPALRKIGDRFITEGRSAILLLPSVLVPQENNVMLNPLHPDTQKMKPQKKLIPFAYDRRLI